MPNEEEIRLNALVAELRSHISDLSIKCATLAGELAVSKTREALLTAQLQAKEKSDAPDRH